MSKQRNATSMRLIRKNGYSQNEGKVKKVYNLKVVSKSGKVGFIREKIDEEGNKTYHVVYKKKKKK